MIYKEMLVSAGLSKEEAEVYEILLSKGEMRTSEIWKGSKQKRSNIYNVARDLVRRGLAEEFEKSGVIYYRLAHPNSLLADLEIRTSGLKLMEDQVRSAIPILSSEFNKILRRPGVQYYEGDAGIKKVLEDSLSSKTEIYTFLDLETVVRLVPDLNKSYVEKREKLKLKKRGIVFDSPAARSIIEGYHRAITDTKFMKRSSGMVEAVMQIYDGKVSYLTLSDEQKIGVIIEDERIFELHKSIFENMWNSLPVYSAAGADNSKAPIAPSEPTI
ncbi:hypothetical protein BH11PAT3_BH11PAT3_2160 [soil metagenome]